MRAPWLTVAVPALALVVGASGCAIIGTDNEPRAIADDEIPENVLAAPTTSTTVPAEPSYFLPLYFGLAETTPFQLIRIDRPVDAEPDIADALNALSISPTQEELAMSYSEEELALLPEDSALTTQLFPDLAPEVEWDDNRLKLTVSGEQMTLAMEDQPARVVAIYSQIVCTVNALRSGDDELFVQIVDQEGTIIRVNVGGELVDTAVSPQDFNDCQSYFDARAEEAAEAEDVVEAEEADDGPETTRRGLDTGTGGLAG